MTERERLFHGVALRQKLGFVLPLVFGTLVSIDRGLARRVHGPRCRTPPRRRGSCRDFAVRFAEAPRSLGFGARIQIMPVTGRFVGDADGFPGMSMEIAVASAQGR
jgi:hypothetical protein